MNMKIFFRVHKIYATCLVRVLSTVSCGKDVLPLKWVDGWKNVRMSEWMNAWIKYLMEEGKNEWMHELIN